MTLARIPKVRTVPALQPVEIIVIHATILDMSNPEDFAVFQHVHTSH
jgi:hypothetical protein